jgi:hypothetical protein
MFLVNPANYRVKSCYQDRLLQRCDSRAWDVLTVCLDNNFQLDGSIALTEVPVVAGADYA